MRAGQSPWGYSEHIGVSPVAASRGSGLMGEIWSSATSKQLYRLQACCKMVDENKFSVLQPSTVYDTHPHRCPVLWRPGCVEVTSGEKELHKT